MKEEFISTGKNVDIAITNGLNIIGKNREDVDIKILEQGGLFKKAKVALIYDKIEVVETVEEIKETQVEEEVKEDNQLVEAIKEVEEIIEEKEEIVQEKAEEVIETEDETEEISTTEDKKIKIVDSSRLKSKITEFLTEFLKKAEVEAEITCIEGENELNFSINGENVGKLIGHRGDTLNAIQYLLGNLKESGEGRIRVYLDISGYKAKREETLVELANKMADKAEEIERNVHLDPMNAYERRIIHTTLQDRELVETESTGEGEKRHVVIKFKR